ncbi:MAG: hypothetical protein AAFY76_00235 [Cyanobacteria bacterium J06649_11]
MLVSLKKLASMNKFRFLQITGVLLTLLSGSCMSNMPLSWDKEIDDDLVGRWVKFNDHGNNDELDIGIVDGQYQIYYKEFLRFEGEYREYKGTGYLTEIDGQDFVNFRSETGSYYVVKVVLKDLYMEVYHIASSGCFSQYYDGDREMFVFPDPETLRKIIGDNMNAPDFFEEPDIYELRN